MKNKHMDVKSLAFIGLITAIVCIAGPFSIPIGPVPVSITNFVLLLAVYLLGTNRAAMVTILYLLIGICGIPVFSEFSGGITKFIGPTGGYLLGFLGMVLISGYLMSRFPAKKGYAILSMLIGILFCYILGTLWLSMELQLSIKEALFAGVIPFIPGDMIKVIVLSFFGPYIKKHLNQIIVF